MSWQDYIKEALEYDVEAFDIREIEEGVESGKYQVWENEGAVLLTAGFHALGGGIGVKIIAACGEMSAALKLLDEVEWKAKESGCKMIRFVGRNGWKKIVSSRGYRQPLTTYVKNL